MTRIDLVIFDLDGVLADSEALCTRLLIEYLAKYDVELDEAHVYRDFVGKSFSHVVESIRQNFECDLPRCFEDDFSDALLAIFSEQLQPTQGVLDVLAELAPQACVATSSSPMRASHTLKIIGMADYFGKHVFTASQVARGKPAPDLFQFAAKRMRTDPSRSLVIEDSIAGVQAALAAKMQVWRYLGASYLYNTEEWQHTAPVGVSAFKSWDQFFIMAPGLKK